MNPLSLQRQELADLRNAFFEAALVGWAAEKEGRIERVTGANLIDYRHRDGFVVEDRRWHGHDHGFVGLMLIKRNGVPRWHMAYHGRLHPAMVRFVRMALVKTYKERIFACGRGPRTYHFADYVYHNVPSSRRERPDFREFRSTEHAWGHGFLRKENWCKCQGGLV